MRITSIWAENFKSFGPKQEIPLPGLTLLIGPNNSGKTNILQVLAVLRGIVRQEIHESELRTTYLRSGAATGKLSVEFTDPTEGSGKYQVAFSEKGLEHSFQIAQSSWGLHLAGLAGTHPGGPAAAKLKAILDTYDIWRLNPEYIDRAWPVQRSVRVGPHGEQAAAVMDHLRDKYPKVYAALQEDLRRCAPEIASVVAEASESSGQKEIVFNERTGITTRSRYASEGLKFLLFVLLILHSPDPPLVLAIEEIEHGVHPRRIADMVGFVRRLAVTPSAPQILLTTHSPYVLDQFRDTPEQVVIVERDENDCTICTPLRKRLKALPAEAREPALGDIWYSGVVGGVPKP